MTDKELYIDVQPVRFARLIVPTILWCVISIALYSGVSTYSQILAYSVCILSLLGGIGTSITWYRRHVRWVKVDHTKQVAYVKRLPHTPVEEVAIEHAAHSVSLKKYGAYHRLYLHMRTGKIEKITGYFKQSL